MAETENRCLLETEAIKMLQAHDIEYPVHALARNKSEAGIQAKSIGFPVVLKVVSPQIIHKSDAGGVRVNLKSSDEVESAYDDIVSAVKGYNPAAQVLGILVCKQAAPGQEVIIGALKDEVFGSAIMFGLGGIFVEVLGDVTFRVCPITKDEALKMIGEIKGFPILSGVRGKAGYDLDALAELLTRVSELLIKHPEIEELDLNPVRVYEKGVEVLDARVVRADGI